MFPILRWCIIANAIWIVGFAGFVWLTYSSAQRHLRFAETWTPKITSANDLDTQRQLSLSLLNAVDNRIAAVQVLRRRIVAFGALVAALGAFNFLFLLRLHRSLRREVQFVIETA